MSVLAETDPPRAVRLESWVGSGASADVYRGTLHSSGGSRPVAVKLLKPVAMLSASYVRDLIAEAWVVRRLKHPSLMRFVELMRLEGQLAMLTEYIAGCDVAVLRRLDERAALGVVAQIADAMAGAPAGFVHRDLKPRNLRVTQAGRVVVVDMGLAQIAGVGACTRAALVGTPPYMAPECFTQGQPQPSRDVFSVGAILFELITGNRLWGRREDRVSRDLRGKAFMHSAWRRIRLEEIRSLPIRKLLSALLQFEPAARPTWREASLRLRDLEASIGGEALSEWCATRQWVTEPESVGQRTLLEVTLD